LFDDEQPECMSYQEVLDVLGDRLDKYDIEVLSALMKRDERFDVSPDKLLDNAGAIGQRLRQIVQKYERDGRIIIPRRPIISAL
jgi:DNA-binding HxlR family transcriptional regulator